MFFRSNDASFARGVLTEKSYDRCKKRSLVSLQMCYMNWFYEVCATLVAILTPQLHRFGVPNLYAPDAILMFVVIPFVHLMNDEETKGIISEEGWYHWFRYVLGIPRKSNE